MPPASRIINSRPEVGHEFRGTIRNPEVQNSLPSQWGTRAIKYGMHDMFK
jgi:hypothetical protein